MQSSCLLYPASWYSTTFDIVERRSTDFECLLRALRNFHDRLLVLIVDVLTVSDDVDAEESCERFMELAVNADRTNPEAYTTSASVRLSQSHVDAAIGHLQQNLELWSAETEVNLPTIESRIVLAKLLIEVAMFGEALDVLEGCQKESDEDCGVWYLFGFCYMQMADSAAPIGEEGEEEGEDREACLQDAKECFDNIIQVFEDDFNISVARKVCRYWRRVRG